MARKTTAGSGSDGWRKMSTGSFPPNHDFKRVPELEGVVTEKKKVPQKRGKKTEEVTVIYVANKDGEIAAVWESAALESFMAEVKPKDIVRIVSKGVQKLKGKKTLKAFDVFIKE